LIPFPSHLGGTSQLVFGLLLATLAGCDAMYGRDVTAQIQGPSQLRVGQEVLLTLRLLYSDGTVSPTEPSSVRIDPTSNNERADWISSDPARATVVSGLVRGVATGDVVITATPSVTTTGTGDRIGGTIRITITE
jgi:hypothetical protein